MAAGEVGTNSYTNAIVLPYQASGHYDGKHFAVHYYPGNGTASANPKIAYALASDLNFGTAHDIPGAIAVTRGYHTAPWYNWPSGYGAFLVWQASGSALKVNYVYKDNDSMNASGETGLNPTEPALGDRFPGCAIDAEFYPWLVAHDGSNLKIARGVGPNLATSFGTPTTLKALSGAPSGTCGAQIVTYANGDVGCLYSNGSSLFYKHWTSSGGWGSEETIATNLGNYYLFRGVVTRNDKLVVIWREVTTEDLKYRVRPRSTGSWGSTADVATDLAGGDSDMMFTSTADHGTDEKAYIFYHDGTNIVYRTYTSSGISGKTTLVSSPTLAGQGNMGAPYRETDKIGVVYHTSDTYIRLAKLEITQEEVASDGVLVSKTGHARQATYLFNKGIVSYGDKLFTIYLSRGHEALCSVYDKSAETFDFQDIVLSKRYWDAHNNPTCAIDGSGYVYTAYGYRNAYNTNESLVLKKSTYPLDHASFDPSSGWTDISPTATSGRGYKFIAVDEQGVPHLILVTSNSTVTIREYRSGAWSSPVNLILISTGDANDMIYLQSACIGKEPSGQKSIHILWSYKDVSVQPEVTDGNILQIELNYAKVVPQGSGSYKAYKADGTEMTLPCSTTVKDIIYNGATESYWVRAGVGIDVLAPASPYLAMLTCAKTTPYAANEMLFFKWSGSAWISTSVQSSGFPWWAVPDLFVSDSDGNIYIFSEKSFSGIEQLVKFSSDDDGDTFSAGLQKTSSLFPSKTPKVFYPYGLYHVRGNELEGELRLISGLDTDFAAVVSQLFVQVEYMIPTSGTPAQERLLRHGSWFGSSVKQRFWWAR